ncbi:MAG: hypothetical protein HN368_09440 [Spirochaetales bacterium]|nr:hypothetical protein [Spirochaetales bacterium]
MESLTQILEEELENSFELKDKKALHRSVLLLVENMTTREKHESQYGRLDGKLDNLRSDVCVLIERMTSSMEGLQKQMDNRFQATDRKFTLLTVFLSIGFTAILTAITVYNFI